MSLKTNNIYLDCLLFHLLRSYFSFSLFVLIFRVFILGVEVFWYEQMFLFFSISRLFLDSIHVVSLFLSFCTAHFYSFLSLFDYDAIRIQDDVISTVIWLWMACDQKKRARPINKRSIFTSIPFSNKLSVEKWINTQLPSCLSHHISLSLHFIYEFFYKNKQNLILYLIAIYLPTESNIYHLVYCVKWLAMRKKKRTKPPLSISTKPTEKERS